ncbi:Diacylglycerol acyltransferase protein [Dioscorea alata]|uniref:Diacylglycerol acyltransferase protein n=1 Tax=Dioscorea alata TaxID=55571 RepID=A0ACB7UMG5_DIOAL|nr:Diacylglycerol acyltransferase protein [Dioscorea alata]
MILFPSFNFTSLRECDRKLVESVLEEAKQQYAEKAKVHPPKVTIDGKVYLPPPPTQPEAHGPFCSGGVVLASQDGKIVLENTLDAGLVVLFRQKLPEELIVFQSLQESYSQEFRKSTALTIQMYETTVAATRAMMENIIQSCSKEVDMSMQYWEVIQLSVNKLNEDHNAQIGSSEEIKRTFSPFFLFLLGRSATMHQSMQ